MFSIQSTTVSQCPAKVFSESKILNAPILNFWSQCLNAFVYTGLNAQKLLVDGWVWKAPRLLVLIYMDSDYPRWSPPHSCES